MVKNIITATVIAASVLAGLVIIISVLTTLMTTNGHLNGIWMVGMVGALITLGFMSQDVVSEEEVPAPIR